MMKTNHSDTEEEEDIGTLELSTDSIEIATNKRTRVIDSDDEDKQDMPAKKLRNSYDNKSDIPQKNTENIWNQNGIDEHKVEKEEKEAVLSENGQNLDEKDLSDSNTNKKNDEIRENETTKLDNENESTKRKNESLLKDKDDSTMDESSVKVKKIKEKTTENKDNTMKDSDVSKNATFTSNGEKDEKEKDAKVIKKEVDDADSKENNEENGTRKKRNVKSRTIDTEVVDGLELSVECASDKEGSSSESTDEKIMKPRPKTIIIKAEPNESELECSSSEEEKSDTQEPTDTMETKPERKRGKRRGLRTSFSKLKASGSEDSQNNNSDEDYSPRTKKKMKKSPATKRSTKRTTESKRGRGGARKNSYKKNTEDTSDDENVGANSANKTNKTKLKDEAEEELLEKESVASKSENNSNSEDEEKFTKGRKKRNNNAKSDDSKHIQVLKKYLSVAGVKIKCYNDIWADCKDNVAKTKRLKELLKKNGVSGRPTMEKCKRAKEENEKLREVSELDTSNIISEGRITRARRSMENKKTNLDISPRHREARNAYKRIQSVVDSDSE